MNYHATGNRCAIDFSFFRLGVTDVTAISILEKRGCSVVEVDIFALLRSLIGISRYTIGASSTLAPEHVDCSSLVQWAYGQLGIELPRLTIEQILSDMGENVPFDELIRGDLIFTSGHTNFFTDHLRVGHVGIATGEGTVVHANRKHGITEIELTEFLRERDLAGIRRYIPKGHKIFTIESPESLAVQHASRLAWMVKRGLTRGLLKTKSIFAPMEASDGLRISVVTQPNFPTAKHICDVHWVSLLMTNGMVPEMLHKLISIARHTDVTLLCEGDTSNPHCNRQLIAKSCQEIEPLLRISLE